MKIYGPYSRKDRRIVVIHYDDGTKSTMQYAKFLMEQHLGRKLNPDKETIDHVDGNAFNDDLSNLQILPRSEHSKLDAKRVQIIKFVCVLCNNIGFRKANQLNHNANLGKAGPFCSKQCAGKYGASVQNGIKKLPVQSTVPIEKRTYYTNKGP
jgi:hypothetical protein